MTETLPDLYPSIEPYETGVLEVSGGHRLVYELCGNPSGRPAVFLHGGPGAGCNPTHRRFFDPAVYRIVLFDQRGAGREHKPAATYPFAACGSPCIRRSTGRRSSITSHQPSAATCSAHT